MAFRRYNRTKYNSRSVTVDGKVFDSEKEFRRYLDLKALEKAGEITDLQTQVKFNLIPAQYETIERYSKTGKRLKDTKKCIEKECSYIADFVYIKNGEMIVEDTKGYRDPSSAGYAKFVIKRKLMLYLRGIRVREI